MYSVSKALLTIGTNIISREVQEQKQMQQEQIYCSRNNPRQEISFDQNRVTTARLRSPVGPGTQRRIRVWAMCPGNFQSPMTSTYDDDDVQSPDTCARRILDAVECVEE